MLKNINKGIDFKLESKNALQKYWGYNSFADMQEDIILSVCESNDTIALLPTGGGKSLCYQIPAVVLPGTAIVISPLISLMKDQIQRLRRVGIYAESISGNVPFFEIERVLNNCFVGKCKLLYIAPERLQNEEFCEKLKHINVSFVAIDEAHCISEWGHDFRKSYTKISDALIKINPKRKNIVALTATATEKVLGDIEKYLDLQNPVLFKKSFFRKNLKYRMYVNDSNTAQRVLSHINNVNQSVIIYMRSRKKTEDMSLWLNKKGVESTFYHAGLSESMRENNQNLWMTGNVKVIVATSAFGMGIDKPDVRLVVHTEIPESIEAYFQQAGRAGRDRLPAEALMILHRKKIDQFASQMEYQHLESSKLVQIYRQLKTFLNVNKSNNADYGLRVYDFNFKLFCEKYKLPANQLYLALNFFESEAYISMDNEIKMKTQIQILLTRQHVLETKEHNPKAYTLLSSFLKIYSEIHREKVKIDEGIISKLSGFTEKEIENMLNVLADKKWIEYVPKITNYPIVFLRNDAEMSLFKNIDTKSKKHFERKKELANSMLRLVLQEDTCRYKSLLNYFGEKKDENCGLCEFCNKEKNTKETETYILEKMLPKGKAFNQSGIINILSNPHFEYLHMRNTFKKLINEGIIKRKSFEYYYE